jgi:hypothetical protein
VSSLAAIVPFPEPPVDWASHVPLSKRARFVLFHGLDKKTHTMYKSYQRSYEDYCYGEGIQPYSATPEKLVEWVALRTEGLSDKVNLLSKLNRFYRVFPRLEQFTSRGSFLYRHSTTQQSTCHRRSMPTTRQKREDKSRTSIEKAARAHHVSGFRDQWQ